MTPMNQHKEKRWTPWMLLILVLSYTIVCATPICSFSNADPSGPVETYQLQPSRWEGLISREGKTYYPLLLVIEEVYPDHSFIGHMKWNPNGMDLVAIEGSAEGNHLTFVDTIMLKGWPGNVTGIKRDVLITGNHMRGTNASMPAVVTLEAEQRPFDEQDLPEYGAKAMKADFQRWKAEIATCRHAPQPGQREICWHSLAFQTQVAVFCNEVSDLERCRTKIQGGQRKEWSPAVAVAIARRMKSIESVVPDLEVLLKQAETMLERISAANDETRWDLIKQYSISLPGFQQPSAALRQSDPKKYDALMQRFDRLSVAFAPFINALSEEQRYLLALYGMTAVQATKERVAAAACEEAEAQSCMFMGHAQYAKGLWVEAKDNYAKACEGKDEDGCLRLAMLEAVNGDPHEAHKDFKMLCTGRTIRNYASCHRLDQLLHALPGQENLMYAPAPNNLQEIAKLPFTLLSSTDEAQRMVGEGMAYFLGIERPVDFQKADRLFVNAASRGIDVFRYQSDVASEIQNSKTHRGYSDIRVWAAMKVGLLNQRICAWNRLSEFQQQFTCTHVFKGME